MNLRLPGLHDTVSQNNNKTRVGAVQMPEHLPGKHKALNPLPSTPSARQGCMGAVLALQWRGQEDPWLHRKLKGGGG